MLAETLKKKLPGEAASSEMAEEKESIVAEALRRKTPEEIKYSLLYHNSNEEPVMGVRPKIGRLPIQMKHRAPRFPLRKENETTSEHTPSSFMDAPVAEHNPLRSAMGWDLKFAIGLIALVVVINLSLTLLLSDNQEASQMQASSASPQVSPAASLPPVDMESAGFRDNAGAETTSEVLPDLKQPEAEPASPENLPAASDTAAEREKMLGILDNRQPAVTGAIPAEAMESQAQPSAGVPDPADRERLLKILNQY